jgi:hypothetical protein
MPLDNTTLSVELETNIDPLTKLGITPVPANHVQKHVTRQSFKMARIDGYLRAHRQWYQMPVHRPDVFLEPGATTEFLKSIMNYGIPGGSHEIPGKLVQIAKAVHQDFETQHAFEVMYSYHDPLLFVTYNHDGKHHRECLGIWLPYAKVIALAGINGNPPKLAKLK